jgi:hypothetical protein
MIAETKYQFALTIACPYCADRRKFKVSFSTGTKSGLTKPKFNIHQIHAAGFTLSSWDII